MAQQYQPQQPQQAQLDPQIYRYFQMADTSRSGWIDINELNRALMNDARNPFRVETCKIMLDMFDRNNCGQINAYQFQELWSYISNWRRTFTGYDKSGDGRLDREETTACLRGMGYAMPDHFFDLCLKKFDLDNAGSFRFDDFVRIGIFVQSVTKSFRRYDPENKGAAAVSFEQLIEMALCSTGTEPKPRASVASQNPYANAYNQAAMMAQPMVINITINNTNTNINNNCGGSDDEEAESPYELPYLTSQNEDGEVHVVCVDQETPGDGADIELKSCGEEATYTSFQLKEVRDGEWAIFLSGETEGTCALTIYSDWAELGPAGNFDRCGPIQAKSWNGFPNQLWQLEEATEKPDTDGSVFLYYIKSMVAGNAALTVEDGKLVSKPFNRGNEIVPFDISKSRRRPFSMKLNTKQITGSEEESTRSVLRFLNGASLLPVGGSVEAGKELHAHPQTNMEQYEIRLQPQWPQQGEGADGRGFGSLQVADVYEDKYYFLRMGDYFITRRDDKGDIRLEEKMECLSEGEFETTEEYEKQEIFQRQLWLISNIADGELDRVRLSNAGCPNFYISSELRSVGGWGGKNDSRFLCAHSLGSEVQSKRGVSVQNVVDGPFDDGNWVCTARGNMLKLDDGDVSEKMFHFNMEAVKLDCETDEADGAYLPSIIEPRAAFEEE